MITEMKEKLERLSREEIESLVFIGGLAERFRRMTETVSRMNQRTEKFINDFSAKAKGVESNEYSRRDQKDSLARDYKA